MALAQALRRESYGVEGPGIGLVVLLARHQDIHLDESRVKAVQTIRLVLARRRVEHVLDPLVRALDFAMIEQYLAREEHRHQRVRVAIAEQRSALLGCRENEPA